MFALHVNFLSLNSPLLVCYAHDFPYMYRINFHTIRLLLCTHKTKQHNTHTHTHNNPKTAL